MEGVAERIDHGHAGVPRDLDNVAVRVHPRHDRRGHARDDLRAVVQRLVHAELDVVLAQEQRVAPHGGDGGLGGDPRSRGELAEEEGYCFAAERVVDG